MTYRVRNAPRGRGQLAPRTARRGWSDPVYATLMHQLYPREQEDFEFTILGRVYFALDAEAGQVKIGLTGNVTRRLRELSAKRGHEVELLGSMRGGYNLERAMHGRFRRYRAERNEWYSAEILPEVLALLTEGGGGHA